MLSDLNFHLRQADQLNLSELFSTDELQVKVDQGFIRVEEAQSNVNTWWEDLSPTEQRNPVNVAKYETANRTIQTAGELTNQS